MWITIIYGILVFILCFNCAFAQIVISEIMANPEGSDTDREWFEAINLGEPIEVKGGRNGWRVYDGKNHYIKSENFIWEKNEIIIFSQNKSKFLEEYPFVKNKVIESSFSIKNSGGTIGLIDENKNPLIKINYPKSDEGYSLIFLNNNWTIGQSNGSPGVYPDTPFERKFERKKEETIQQLKETISATTTEQKVLIEKPPILFINEFLPNLKGRDDEEFIELLNETGKINLNEISIKVGEKKLNLKGETDDKFIVLHKKDYGFNIRNKGEEIVLYWKDKEIHKISYTGNAPEGKSFSRIYNKWYWTKPTLGEENVLVEEEDSQMFEDEIIKNNSEDGITKDENKEMLLGEVDKIYKSQSQKNNLSVIIIGILFSILLAVLSLILLR